MMSGYAIDVQKAAEENEFFRKVLYTSGKSQLVLMSLRPKEDIGLEVHDGDQILCIVKGSGVAVIGGIEHRVGADAVVVVPAGVNHNVAAGEHAELKLYTVYAPPQHAAGTVHRTKSEAVSAEHEEAWKK